MRSTVITASAVSEEMVAPGPPIAIPTSARASAGASLTPSPTITTGASSGRRASARRPRACPPGSARRRRGRGRLRGDPLGDGPAVAGDHRHPLDAVVAQPDDQLARVVAQAIGHHDHPGQPPVDADHHPGEAVVGAPLTGRSRSRGRSRARAARRRCPPSRGARRRLPPCPARAPRSRRRASRAAAPAPRRRGRAPRPGRGRRAGRPTRPVAGSPPGGSSSSGITSWTAGVPSVSVPVLSRRTVRASPEALDRRAALDDHPGARRPRDAGDDRDRRGRISGQGVATTSTATARTGSPLSAQAPPATARVNGRKKAA